MSKRIVLLTIPIFFALGDSIALAQPHDNQNDWDKVIQIADQVQLLILRFSPLLLAIAVVAIHASLVAIKSALISLKSSIDELAVTVIAELKRSRNESK